VGTAATTIAAAFNASDRGAAMWEAFLEVGANSFPLLLIGLRVRIRAAGPEIARSPAWQGAALLAFAAFAATLGHGLP